MRYDIFFRQSDENQGKRDSQYSCMYSSSIFHLSSCLYVRIFIRIILSWQEITDIFTYGFLRTGVMEKNSFCLKRGQNKTSANETKMWRKKRKSKKTMTNDTCNGTQNRLEKTA